MNQEAKTTRINEEIISTLSVYLMDTKGFAWSGKDLFELLDGDSVRVREIIESYKENSLVSDLDDREFTEAVVLLTIAMRWYAAGNEAEPRSLSL